MNYQGTHSFDDGDTCAVCYLDVVDMQAFGDNVPPCKTRRVNSAKYRCDVYVGRGRGSPWGNPFKIGADGTRDEVIAEYEAWIQTRPDLLAKIPTLAGKILGCWCDAAEACHADVLIRLADASWPTKSPDVQTPVVHATNTMGSLDEDLDLTVVILDTETTGKDTSTDQVIELAMQFGFGTEQEPATQLVWRFKPTINIHPEALAVHGISQLMLAGEDTFKAYAARIHGFIERAQVLVGYNLTFDLTMLAAEFARCGFEMPALRDKSLIDPLRLWQVCEPRKLTDAHRRFVGSDFTGAHSAGADVAATANVLLGMLETFGQTGRFWDEISELCNPERKSWLGDSRHFIWKGDEVVVNFGKHAGKAVTDAAAKGYLKWMIGRDFPLHVLQICRAATSAPTVKFYAWARAAYPPPVPPPAELAQPALAYSQVTLDDGEIDEP